MNKLYAIKPSPGKGRGVFATKAIAAGTIIMKDKVALRVQKAPPSVQEADVLKGFNKLSKADQRRFLELHEGNRLYGKIFRIWKANVFGGGDESTVLYFEVSLINHACVPNAEVYPEQGGYADVVALKPIATGEEIYITYNPMFDSLSKAHRGNTLRLYYGFDCSCFACFLPADQQILSDARRQLLDVLNNALENCQPIDTRIFDLCGTLNAQQAEHPLVIRGTFRLPLKKHVSMEQKAAYRLLVAGLLVAEGHSRLVLADAYATEAERLLHRMQVLDNIISIRAVKAVESQMQMALKVTEELCGKRSKRLQDLQQMWKYMLDTEQMSATMLLVRHMPAKDKKSAYGIRLGEIVNGGLHTSILSESEYWAAVRQQRRPRVLS